MVSSKKLKQIKGSFKKYAEKKSYKRFNTLKDGVIKLPTIEPSRTITDCSNKMRYGYCCGNTFRNPIVGYRKVLNKDACTIKTQEIYKEPFTLACENYPGTWYDRRIRSINYKNGTKDAKYNYNYGQYLRRKCKSYKKQQDRYLDSNSEYKISCCGDEKDRCTTYKPKNKQYDTNGAVSSSARLVRLKYNTQLASQNKNCKNGEFTCGIYTSVNKYGDVNLKPKKMDTCHVTGLNCPKMRIGGVMRNAR